MITGKHTKQSGYSLIEMSLVVTVVLILAALTIPTAATMMANIKLRGAASDFAGLVQQARITAVKKNAVYTIHFGVPSGNGAYIDLNGNSSYDSGEPMIQFGGNANQVAAPGGTPSNLDATSTPLGWTATSGNVSFNARGLTCDVTATPCGTNVNYIFYFEDTRALGGHGWAAVSITAAARSKVWFWNGSSWIN
jgi:prepilin-type N-terminal cleavage/methylation domain-containing protein